MRSGDRRRTAGVGALFVLLLVLFAIPWGRASDPWPPSFEDLRTRWQPSYARLLDHDGVVLHERRVDESVRRLAWTRLSNVSPAVIDAVLLSEDQRFRSHGGVDFRALAAATRDAVRGGRTRGASTITMQVAALLRPELAGARGGRSLVQKARQIQAARELEARWSKDQILEAYLNLASFRGELQGVAAAARGLFGKEPHGVDGAEALVLAALLRAPNAEPARVAERAARLARRAGDQVSSETAAGSARAVLLHPPLASPAATLALHLSTRLLPRGTRGDVRTTLDANIQRLAMQALREQLLILSGQNVSDGAVLVVENASGDVLAWIGSSGALSQAPQVDGVRARRQAGSTLKPFLYALAFEERLLTPASRIDDTPLDVATPTGIYRPENYDHQFRGLVSARVALASSLNVPAVRTVQLVGVERFVSRLAALGFEELRRPDFYGESVALGSADVTLVELVNAYRTLANGGLASPLRLRDGAPAAPARVFTPQASFLVAQILSDRASRSATFGLESTLATPVWTAVKTGTSKDMRDNWCIGFSADYTVGVWVGNFSGAPMWQVSGVDGAAPVWLELMQALHRNRPSKAPATPDGVASQDGEWYLAGTEPVPMRTAEPEGPRRIRAPSNGTIVARDPDIPHDRQRVFLESEPPDQRLAFRVDGQPAGSAGSLALWAPVRGKHRLELVDAAGSAIDTVRFEVR